MDNLIKETMKTQSQKLDFFLKAWLEETGLKPSEAILVQKTSPYEITWSVEKKIVDDSNGLAVTGVPFERFRLVAYDDLSSKSKLNSRI